MISWTMPELKPDINHKDKEDVELGLSEKCVCIIDDKSLGYPVTFGRYSHKLNEWIFEGYRGGRFTLIFWSAITKPAHLNL